MIQKIPRDYLPERRIILKNGEYIGYIVKTKSNKWFYKLPNKKKSKEFDRRLDCEISMKLHYLETNKRSGKIIDFYIHNIRGKNETC